MTVLYVEKVDNPNMRFRVTKYDPETKQGRLIGDLGCEFDQNLARASVESRGYTLKAYEDEDDPGLHRKDT